jgi:chemotaxis protein MotB
MRLSSIACRSVGLVSFVLMLTSGVACQNKVMDENIAFRQQNRELQARLMEDDEKLKQAPDPAQLAAMQKELSDRDAKIAELEANLKKPAAGAPADPALAGIETSYDSVSGALTVRVPGDVLFDPGLATLKGGAMSTLDKISSAVRKDYPGKPVRVNGYTDSDPINRTKANWNDNWDLSYARAKTVMNYLSEHGVDNHHLSIVANGSNSPRGNKSQSRRVEIVVLTK